MGLHVLRVHSGVGLCVVGVVIPDEACLGDGGSDGGGLDSASRDDWTGTNEAENKSSVFRGIWRW